MADTSTNSIKFSILYLCAKLFFNHFKEFEETLRIYEPPKLKFMRLKENFVFLNPKNKFFEVLL